MQPFFVFSVRLHLHIQIFVIGLNMEAPIDYEAQVDEEIIAELDQNMHPPLDHDTGKCIHVVS
jgi:hypothetical protein